MGYNVIIHIIVPKSHVIFLTICHISVNILGIIAHKISVTMMTCLGITREHMLKVMPGSGSVTCVHYLKTVLYLNHI